MTEPSGTFQNHLEGSARGTGAAFMGGNGRYSGRRWDAGAQALGRSNRNFRINTGPGRQAGETTNQLPELAPGPAAARITMKW